MLTGLPDEFKPMSMGLESSVTAINAAIIKTQLLQDVNYTKEIIALPINYNVSSEDQHWYLDSGATEHMSSRRTSFVNYESMTGKTVTIADKRKVFVVGKGDIFINAYVNKKVIKICLKDVLHVPDLGPNLISMNKLTCLRYKIVFSKNDCSIFNRNNEKIAEAGKLSGMYKIIMTNQGTVEKVHGEKRANAAVTTDQESALWHRRLAHLNRAEMMKLNKMATGYSIKKCSSEPCKYCILDKNNRKPFSNSGHKAKDLLQLIHTDLCGPMEVNSIGEARYYVSFTDDHSNYTTFFKT